jgi:hypothetical protein
VYSNFDRARDTPSVELSVDMIRLLVSRGARLDVRWNGLTLAELAKAHFIPRVQGEFDASTPSASDAERQKLYEVKRRKVLQLLNPGKAAPPSKGEPREVHPRTALPPDLRGDTRHCLHRPALDEGRTNSHPLEHPRDGALPHWKAPRRRRRASRRSASSSLRVLADEVEIAPDAEALEDFRGCREEKR